MNLHDHLKETIKLQVETVNDQNELIDNLTRLMVMEVRVIATAFARHASQNPSDDYGTELSNYLENKHRR